MDHNEIELIEAAMAAEDRTRAWTARKAGIPHATFHRKMQGGTAFTLPELARIARALNRHPADLLPTQFVKAA